MEEKINENSCLNILYFESFQGVIFGFKYINELNNFPNQMACNFKLWLLVDRV
jgi:hypothetical protein